MSETTPASSPDRLEAAVAEYLEAAERGERLDRQALLDRFADVADELAEFLADHDRLAAMATPFRRPDHQHSHSPDAAKTDLLNSPQPADARQRNRPEVRSIGCPEQIDEYEIVAELGRGGMGVVYRARHSRLGREVALKTILSGRTAGGEELQRFHAEARSAAALTHAGIVPIYDDGECDGQPYFVMQLVEGQSLAEYLQEGPLPPLVAARLLRKIVSAVAYAHAKGVIHRDLKPGNILLARCESLAGESTRAELDQCEPKITDFGLAKRLDVGTQLTATGQILGTPSYMPPEQAAGRQQEVNEAADVYSLGGILYAMLTGRPPFVSDNPVEVLLQVLESEPSLPHTLQADVPRELEWICLKCLEKNPADRYASAVELAADLDRFLRHEPPLARRPTVGQALRRWMRRQPVLAWHLIGLGALATLAQGIYFVNWHDDLAYHFRVSGVLLLWMAFCLAFQWLIERRRESRWPHYLWSVGDAALLTALLSQVVSPLGPLLGGYLLLVCASGLFFQTRLVATTTASAMLGYVALLLLRPEEIEPLHYAVLFLTTLAICGLVIGYQVWKMGVLREYYEDRRLQ
jgi:eukaryotic-like serine/threonine-protein kinase